MNIDETIRLSKGISENGYIGEEDRKYHKQLAEWLEELSVMKEREKKYRWHDLRKNPDDIPQAESEVDIVCERKFTSGKRTLIRTHGFYEDGTLLENDSIWGWEYLDGEYIEEEDCHIIPEGWLEYRHYNPDGCYNGVVDDRVIAWREIEPFEAV